MLYSKLLLYLKNQNKHFRQPEDTTNPYFILSPEKSQKQLLAHELIKSCYIITTSNDYFFKFGNKIVFIFNLNKLLRKT